MRPLHFSFAHWPVYHMCHTPSFLTALERLTISSQPLAGFSRRQISGFCVHVSASLLLTNAMDFLGRHEKYIVYGAGPFVTTLMSKHVPSFLFPSTGPSPYFTHGPASATPVAKMNPAEMTSLFAFL